MCGIAGTTKQDLSRNIKKMILAMRHRGYDGDYFLIEHGKIALGMNRLAINDLSKNLYPFRYKQYVLFFNGEIYNHTEIYSEYLKGNFFRKTTCDAEIILPLFEKFGQKAFSLLEGMFSLCIFDTNESKIYLARDQFGEKLLYYTIEHGQLSFGSELKSLLALPNVQKEISLSDLADYLVTGSTFEHTLLKGIHKLQPGKCLIFDLVSKKLLIKKYLISKKIDIDTADLPGQLDFLLSQAVKDRSTKLAHVFLSGGIDSGLLTYYSTLHSKNVTTYSVTFSESLVHNEGYFSNLIASHLSTEQYQIDVTGQMIKAVLENIGSLIDHPFSDPACIPTFILAKMARKNTLVALAGEGADELFGGYDRYWNFGEFFSNVSKRKSNKKEYIAQKIWNDDELVSLGLITKRSHVFAASLKEKQTHDLNHYLPDQLLAKMDVFSMRNNLEVRSPFLDSKLLSFATHLSDSQKVNIFGTKFLLRKLAKRHLPVISVVRPKHGLAVPLGNWIRSEPVFRSIFFEVIENSTIINKEIALKYFDEHLQGKANHKHKLWSLYVFFSWAKENGIHY